MLRIASQAGYEPLPIQGRLRLEAEIQWVITGSGASDEPIISAVQSALPVRAVQRIADALVVRFTNEVGLYKVPGLPAPVLEVVSGKWRDADYEAMLSEICARISALPFTAGTGAQLPYDRSFATDPRVLYHAYVYLRHILSESAPRDARLVPSLLALIRNPHYRLDRTRCDRDLHRCKRVDARTLRRVPLSTLQRSERSFGAGALSEALRGYLPVTVDEPTVRHTYDVPENRFVKAFIGQCVAIIETIAGGAGAGGSAFAARIQGECAQMMQALRPVRQASLWNEVGPMTRLPAESTVLQQRQGYREVFRHFLRLRMTTRIPFNREDRDMLEVKDIASLYEMWCFFAVEKAVSAILGPPNDAASATIKALQLTLGYDLRVTWCDGTQLAYNLRFSRSRPTAQRSYSIPLRPDITLRLPNGRAHLLDAKFRLRKLTESDSNSGFTSDDDDESDHKADERRGDFKREDIYKMHTYRDALGSATAWVLYPGDVFQFFVAGTQPRLLTEAEALAPLDEGVGGIPLVPGQDATVLRNVIGRMLAS